MAVLKFTNFGGVMPRLSPRALPAGAAQVNMNLMATSTEFRPMMADLQETTAVAGALSLYRMERGSNGLFQPNDSTGWISDAADKNFVKGQINDDATDRTYVSWNDGTQPPYVIDALGNHRLLGVNPPANAPVITYTASKIFDTEDALTWEATTFIPALEAAINNFLNVTSPGANYTSSGSVAGVNSYLGLTPGGSVVSYAGVLADASYLFTSMTPTVASQTGLNNPQLNAVESGGSWWIPFQGLPAWGQIIDIAGFTAALRLITNPKTGAQLWTDVQLPGIVSKIVAWFTPATASTSLAGLQTSLGNQLKNFVTAISGATSVAASMPQPPTQPTTPKTYTTVDPNSLAQSVNTSPDWVAYDNAWQTYQQVTLPAWQASNNQLQSASTATIQAIITAQQQAKAICTQITTLYSSVVSNIPTLINKMISDLGLVQSASNITGLVAVDPTPIIETRFYLATFVTDWGEESMPSAISAQIDVANTDPVTLTLTNGSPGQYVKYWNLYRTNTGTSATAFQFVDQIPIGTTTYIDSLSDAQLSEVLSTTSWYPPPTRTDPVSGLLKGTDPYLKGLVGMPNGIQVGFIDNYLAPCDPYHPYAFPPEYQVPLEFTIVGIGVFGSTIFVGTNGHPYFVSGSDAASLTAQRLDDSQSCVSRKSIVAVQGGAFYASPDGICFASMAGVDIITGGLFAHEDFQALNPSSIIAVVHDNTYYFFYDGYGTPGCYALDVVQKKMVSMDMVATAVFEDTLSDGVFYANGGYVYRMFTTGRRTGDWRSGVAVLPAQAPFQWLQVDGNQSVANPATVKWYGDGVLRYTATVTSITPVRLPAGRYLEHEIEIISTQRITKVMIAGSTEELKSA